VASREANEHKSASSIGSRRALDAALLGSVSLLALLVASGRSEAYSLRNSTGGAASLTAAAQQAALAAAQQAAAAGAQSQQSMARAAAALAAARRAQQSAAAAAQALSSSIPSGLATGGLMPYGGTSSDPTAGIKADPTKWVGANLPTETVSGSNVTVNITQTQQKGIFYWNSFNVSPTTTVNFNQSASDWVALNRVVDPSASPSKILGHVNALGSVYLINGNGIIFGAGAQINVHTLVASSLDIGVLGTDLTARDQYFLNTGIANLNSFSVYDPSGAGAATTFVPGNVTVERGATITANVTKDIVPLGSAGSVYLFGANVDNSGDIVAPTGEVGLVAARTIDLVPNGYSTLPTAVLGTNNSGATLSFRGTEFRISQFAASYNPNTANIRPGYPNGNPYLPGTGAVTHDGLIEASRGIVIMDGDRITIGNPTDAAGHNLTDPVTGSVVQGVISVDTSVDRNGMVILKAATSIAMNGVISSQPYDDGAPALPAGTSFALPYVEMTAQSSVTVGSTGLISAPSAQVALSAANILETPATTSTPAIQNLFNQGGNPNVSANSNSAQTVVLASGATIDVSGLQNVKLPASYNFTSFQPRAEFADMPLQRNGVLYGQTLWIDIRDSGTRSDGTTWVGTPLADASGYVNEVGRSISQLMTTGGSVSLKTDLTSGAGGVASVQTTGSVINLAGGSITFLPGMVRTTRLIGADGHIYSMANADPNMTYVGIAGQFKVDHSRWGVTETWSTQTETFSPGYTQGANAGALSVTTVNPLVQQGTVYFGSVAGARQIASGQLPSQGSLTLETPSSVVIGSTPSQNFTTQSLLTTTLSDQTLSSYGLSALTLTANDLVVSSGATLSLAAGGTFSATVAGAIDIAGTVVAQGGAINLVTDRTGLGGTFSAFSNAPTDRSGKAIAANVYVEGTLDVSGRFVNDTGRFGTDASGPAYINGGSISITTDKSSGSVQQDTTGSILLATGSLLDASSGGYITPQGKPLMASAEAMAGTGGSISLALYQGDIWNAANQSPPTIPSPSVSTVAAIELDGALRAYGFAGNGSLTLDSADTIRIGGTLQPGETSSIRIGGVASTLPVSLLTGGGFGSYTISTTPDGWSSGYLATGTLHDGVVISAGVNLRLQQQNLSSLVDYSLVSTGTRLGQQATPALATLPDDQRAPVNLTVQTDNFLLDTGAKIVTDAKAAITVGARSTNTALAATDPTRNVPATSVTLLGSIIDHSGSVFINALQTQLGPQALVDLSGTFVANSTFGLPKGAVTSGTLLPGGTFTVEGGAIGQVLQQTTYAYSGPQNSYLVAQAGAVVDVSGYAGAIQVEGAHGATSSVWSWSDAGTVSADVNGFAWGGSFVAMGGRYTGADGVVHADPRANNGTIVLGGAAISLRQDATEVQNVLTAFQGGIAPTSIFVGADQLAPFDTVYLYAGSAQGGAGRIFTDMNASDYGYAAPNFASLNITGSLNWSVANRLHIAAGVINSVTAGNAQLSAPYVLLTGSSSTAASSGSGTFTVRGQTIDVEGAIFKGYGQVSLISSGDIRLGTPKIVDGLLPVGQTTPVEASTFTGQLAAGGDVLLSAQRIYPVTAVTFTIETPGNVQFAAPAGSNTAIPLSAGGGIMVIANTIDQAGNLFAPLGTITLGNSTTQSVTLEPGSLTSVTLADTTVPYGATVDVSSGSSQSSWYYNANLNPLAAPPAKGLILDGVSVTRAQGSTIDLRGGGDLQAMEWIQGKGGSRDTLTTTPSGQTVYALVPSQNAPVAAIDLQFLTARSSDGGKTVTSGDVDPLVGTQITIAGGGGIPAGTYTLYPAHYATLPGAMRVVTYGSNLGVNIPSGTTLPDGTVLVTGYTTQSTVPGKQSSGQTVFAVQTNAVWQSYSEYTFTSANKYFAQLATNQGNTPPPLPMDAGRLAVVAQQTILLNGSVLAQPGQDSSGNIGRGGELDISAPQLEVVGHAQYVSNDVLAGYVGLDVTQLNGFESILIGGQRTDATTTTGTGANTTTNTITLITPTATNIVVDTRGDALTAPEILMVAQQVGQWQEVKQVVNVGSSPVVVDFSVYQPVAGTGAVTIKAGSIIETTGIVHTGLGRNYQVVSSGQAPVTAASLAAALGGTLSASGTEIDNADLANLPAFWFVNGFQSTPTTVSNTASQAGLSYYANGGAQQPGRGALFVATDDPTLTVTGPTAAGVSAPALTIKFADVTSADAAKVGNGAPTGAVTGSLTLAGGDTTGNGQVTIEAGARISTNTLTLQATASHNAIALNTTDLHATRVNLTAQTIGIGTSTPVSGQSLVLASNSGQFANVQALTLKTLSGPVTVYGDFNPGTGSLTLDASGLAGGQSLTPGTTFTVTASDTITLKNTGATPYAGAAAVNGTTLDLSANEIDLGSGPVNGNSVVSKFGITGFATVNMVASNSMVIKGPGALTLGLSSGDTVNLDVATPIIHVDSATGASSQSFAITSWAGNVNVADVVARTTAATRPTDSSEIGGSLTITAANINVASTIQAQAGTITLDAIAGNVTLGAGAYLAAGGYKKTLVDVDTYVAGGKVVLYADPGTSLTGGGSIITGPNSIIDVAQPVGGLGYGGEIDVTALRGNATLAGQLLGRGGAGLGGNFNLDIQGAADLTALAGILGSGGITGTISIHTHTGNLVLAQGATLTGNSVTLTADDPTWQSTANPSAPSYGQVIIAGTIDARGYAGNTADGTGQAGGQVGLFGQNAVVLTGTGRILASTTHGDERGGDVTIGIDWYAGGNIDLQAGSVIDVSGGSKGGLSGGTLTLRAPLNGNNDVQIAGLDANITGARAVTVQGFVSIDTTAQGQGLDGSSLTTKNGTPVVWDGIIDPAGAVSSNGQPVNFGSWTNVTGSQLQTTAGTGYTAPPAISVVTKAGTGTSITGTTFVDPQTGATYYQVTDPVTGTTFRSSLQVASITITNGGSYTSAPTVTITPANGTALPNWGTGATATAVMGLNPITVNNIPVSQANGASVRLYDASGAEVATGKAVVTNGLLTGVTNITQATGPGTALIGSEPVKIIVGSIFSSTTITSGFSGTMAVTGVTLSGGAGYSGAVNISFSGGTPATATATMGAAVTVTGVTTGYASAASLPKLTISGTGTGATASFATQATGFTGTTSQSDVFTPTGTSNVIPVATSDVFAGSKGTDNASLTIAPYQPHVLFYSDVLANFIEGNGLQGTDVTGNWGFSGILNRLNAPGGLVSQLGASVVHFQPGVDLVNSSPTINSGNITVASNWNLAAGTAGNLQTGTNSATNTSFTYFDPATSYVNFAYRLATPWGSLEAGALTVRAAGSVNVNASISDGFYQFGNYLDSNYVTWVNQYLSSLGVSSNGSGIDNRVIDSGTGQISAYYLNSYSSSAVPIAPYQAAGNSISPTSQDLATADLFPNQLRVCTTSCSAQSIITVTAPSSWSISLTGGADTTSANPRTVIPLANAQAARAGSNGDVIVSNHTTYTQTLIQNTSNTVTSVTVNLPTMVRTGTGSIDITAARDVVMSDTVSPGVVYAAGVNEPNLPGANYSGTSSVAVGNAAGFFQPQVLAYGNNGVTLGLYFGPPTAAAFPEQGGDVDITAQRDIIGYSGSGNKVVQYYQPWLLSDAGVTPVSAAGGAGNLFGEGVYTPAGSQIASQTAWWIQYGSFQQGFLSAGGNVSVIAGRDLVDVSVSLPTTGRVSGGLSATDTPVTHIYGSGNMIVRAGQDILGGSFYEGSGHAVIVAGGSIGQNGTVSRSAASKLQMNDYPLLAVDTGQISMVAAGSITVAGVVNPAALHAQAPNFANVLETGSTASQPLYVSTYGPDSKVRLVADTGNLTISIAPTAVQDGSVSGQTISASPSTYPASFEALALGGSLITTGISQIALGQAKAVSIPMPGIVLSESDHGTFDLLAQDNVDLTFGYPQNTLLLSNTNTPRPYISAGPSLIETAFDPFQPDSGYTGSFAGAKLAHADDGGQTDTTARIYAATGDITGTGSYGPRWFHDSFTGYVRTEINRPANIYAGQDIVDLNLIVQNIRPSDVSTVQAGRNIYYTGYNNAGGLQVAGPGNFVVDAGGSIGPFLPAAHDFAAQAGVQEGIASVGDTSTIPVGNLYVPKAGGSIGLYDESLLGPSGNPRRNALLTTPGKPPQGADVIVLFGAKFGADYQAVINTYIDPANAANVAHNYVGELQTFLVSIDQPPASNDPATVFNAFQALPANLQHVFVDQVFFAELKAVGISEQTGTVQYQRGYEMINTMFPSSLGYTANALGSGTNGANQLVSTGDLNLLHGTIQTQQGGSVSIFGPGGSILVGSLATEPNSALKLSDLGILTLAGGDINTFTDQNVLVNSSRVLTTQGGDVLMWSSNGNLDAGRGSKTVFLTPALEALYNQDDYESVDLGGFVTGSGIGTLETSAAAAASNLYLLAPRGTVDAGTAGIRVSGNLVVVAPVVLNASNIQVQGTSNGIPTVSVPNIGALAAGNNTAGASVKSTETPTGSTGNHDQPSVFLVEVLGYGGGEGQNQQPTGSVPESAPQGGQQQPDNNDNRGQNNPG